LSNTQRVLSSPSARAAACGVTPPARVRNPCACTSGAWHARRHAAARVPARSRSGRTAGAPRAFSRAFSRASRSAVRRRHGSSSCGRRAWPSAVPASAAADPTPVTTDANGLADRGGVPRGILKLFPGRARVVACSSALYTSAALATCGDDGEQQPAARAPQSSASTKADRYWPVLASSPHACERRDSAPLRAAPRPARAGAAPTRRASVSSARG
jgi:hypothetical protein